MVVALLAMAAAFLPSPPLLAQETTGDSPVGTYVWFPDREGPKSDDDCRKLVDRLKPSVDQAEQLLWGQMPNLDPENGPYYIIISKTRMETTFSAEGDFDVGDLSLGPTKGGLTNFVLTPDEHREEKVQGTILARPDSQVVVVTLKAPPAIDGFKDRVTYYCRFDDKQGTQT
jgi:hypothetical protein